MDESEKKHTKMLDYNLPHYKFLLSLPKYREDKNLIEILKKGIKNNNMAPWYKLVCSDLKWNFDSKFYEEMMIINKQQIQQLDEIIMDAQHNYGDMEVRTAHLKKAKYYSFIGDKKQAVNIFQQILEETCSPNYQIYIIFHLLRIGFFFMDKNLIGKSLNTAANLNQQHIDLDNQNILNIYKSLYCIVIRDFKTASKLLTDSMNTFTADKLLDYKILVSFAVYTSVISLSRKQIYAIFFKNRIIDEIQSSHPIIYKILYSLYNCEYKDIFSNLAELKLILLENYLFHLHCDWYIKEIKILTYNQLIKPYKSLSFQYIADTLDVTIEYVENDLSKYIQLGRLHCKLDIVNKLVEINLQNVNTSQLNAVLHQGDLLLSKMQHLVKILKL